MDINNVADFEKIFPYLPKRSKFKTAINKVFKSGINLQYEEAGKGMRFRGGNGGSYNSRLRFNEKGKIFQIKKVSTTSMTVKEFEADPKRNLSIDMDREPSAWHLENGEEIPLYQVKRESYAPTSWGQIAYLVGQLVGDQFADLEPCSRCGGSGRLYEFAHVENGLCFKCCGVGKFLTLNK